MRDMTADHFRPHIGSVFRLDAGEGREISLSLTEVRDLGPRPERLVKPGQRTHGFFLRFAGPLEPVLPQQIWTLTHESFGSLGIFLVPLGPHDGRLVYEAVFN
jgi:hypothetical protein